MTESGLKKLATVIISALVLVSLLFIYFLPEEKQDGDGHYKESKKQSVEDKPKIKK
jgi:hypothetical protein